MAVFFSPSIHLYSIPPHNLLKCFHFCFSINLSLSFSTCSCGCGQTRSGITKLTHVIQPVIKTHLPRISDICVVRCQGRSQRMQEDNTLPPHTQSVHTGVSAAVPPDHSAASPLPTCNNLVLFHDLLFIHVFFFKSASSRNSCPDAHFLKQVSLFKQHPALYQPVCAFT